MLEELDGRVAVVTGAASGIGLAMSEAFLAEGMHVVLSDRDEASLDAQVARLAEAGGSVSGVVCDVVDPHAGGMNQRGPYSRDPRYVARKAERYLREESGIADVSYWGPELEFFIFDTARFHQDARSGYYFVDSDEGAWNSGREATLGGELNLSYQTKHKEGYFPVPPIDSLQDLRSQIVLTMVDLGVHMEVHHHEVATAGQAEIDAVVEQVKTDLGQTQGEFVVFHDAYQYFEHSFGVSTLGAISLADASDPSVARIAEIRDAIAEANVSCVFSEPQFNPGLVATVAEGRDVKSVVIDPLGTEIAPGASFYTDLLSDIGAGFVECLSR